MPKKLLTPSFTQRKTIGVECETVQVEHKLPYRAIIDIAETKRCDLIVMASHGRHGVSAIVLGNERSRYSHIVKSLYWSIDQSTSLFFCGEISVLALKHVGSWPTLDLKRKKLDTAFYHYSGLPWAADAPAAVGPPFKSIQILRRSWRRLSGPRGRSRLRLDRRGPDRGRVIGQGFIEAPLIGSPKAQQGQYNRRLRVRRGTNVSRTGGSAENGADQASR